MSDTAPDADIEAMRRLSSGDDLALNGIMHRWRDKLAAYLYRSTGSHEAACDLAQETFVKLYQSRHRYQPGAAFSSYLFRIAANLARNHARWRKRHPAVSIESEEGLGADDLTDEAGTPEENLQSRELHQRIEKALASLPQELREPLHLFTYEEMNQSDIAAALGCSVKAVETRIYRARQMLRGLLDGEGR